MLIYGTHFLKNVTINTWVGMHLMVFLRILLWVTRNLISGYQYNDAQSKIIFVVVVCLAERNLDRITSGLWRITAGIAPRIYKALMLMLKKLPRALLWLGFSTPISPCCVIHISFGFSLIFDNLECDAWWYTLFVLLYMKCSYNKYRVAVIWTKWELT